MKKGLAKIQVAYSFCENCAPKISKELLKLDGISNVHALAHESKVVFHFKGAYPLSNALNKLMEIGHPPLGDVIKQENYVPPLCKCDGITSSAA